MKAPRSTTTTRACAALFAAFFLTALAFLALPPFAAARITRIVITRVESPTFAGTSFGTVGQYEKLVGRAYGEVDPADPRNAIIVDLGLAPKNAAGKVEYSTDIVILRPVDRSMGNHRVLYDVNNRGNLTALPFLNDGLRTNDPTTAADAGNGFLMREGYTIVSSGWDATTPSGLAITVPVARNPDGSSIVGPALEEFVIDNSTTMTGPLTYAATTPDKSIASLTVRVHYTDPPTPIPATDWGYVSPSLRAIRLLPAGTPFQQGRLYEFSYPAKDPLVVGLGFAATRDLAAFLRHAATDDVGNLNPLAGNAQSMYTFCYSQPCRFLHDFLHLGFNEDELGRRVIDGMLNWAGGGSGGFFNYRFAQPGRTHRQHIGRWYPERQFPFADQVIFDPVTGTTDGRLARCSASVTCPKIFESNSENEYWVKGGSLLHTDTLGNDLSGDGTGDDQGGDHQHGDNKNGDNNPANVRFYLFSSLPHAAASGPGICQQPRNPLGPNPGLRALLVGLDQWVTAGTEPPDSRVPRRGNGTLVTALPQRGVGFPTIPGVTYNGRTSTGDLFDFGSLFGQGILTTLPPMLLGSPYPVFVPTTDADGNDVAGIRLPDVAVPLATYSGWNVRTAAFAGDDLCDASGQKIDFAQTQAERLASGDPRLSIEERYRNHATYVRQVTRAANRLHEDRFLLDEDVERYVASAAASSILTGWSTPVNLGPTINTTALETGPALSKNGLSLYFYSNRPGGSGGNDIWVSQRKKKDDAWGTPVNLGPTINSASSDFVPAFSRDGHWMFFASDRPGGFGLADIWASWRPHTHDDFGWQAPTNLGAGVNTAFNDNGVGYFENDEAGPPQLFFGSDRPGGAGGTDLYMSELQTDGSWGLATRIPELSSTGNDNRPTVRHDGLEIFFYSDRAGGVGGIDLWVATRATVAAPWSTPVNLDAPVNTTLTELHPYLAADAETLFFSSSRPGTLGGLDLYVTTRSKSGGQDDDHEGDQQNGNNENDDHQNGDKGKDKSSG